MLSGHFLLQKDRIITKLTVLVCMVAALLYDKTNVDHLIGVQ